ncbi:MAG TPA: hypothetical protein DCK93_09995 [Blastocatellia bacterium]|jgi:hypothetical protein|nr:hypothetical protein [Blastocatellia bacterium]
MSTSKRKSVRAIAVFLAFAIAQVYIQLSFAQTAPRSFAAILPQQFVAQLTTSGNAPISVNGAPASTGATILSGAILETPPGVSASIDLGPIGKIDLAPGTKIRLEYECTPDPQNANEENCKAKVTVITGCVVATNKKNRRIQLDTEQQEKARESKKGAAGVLNLCVGPAAGAAAAAGLSLAAKLAIAAAFIGAIGGIIAIFHGGGNPSPAV